MCFPKSHETTTMHSPPHPFCQPSCRSQDAWSPQWISGSSSWDPMLTIVHYFLSAQITNFASPSLIPSSYTHENNIRLCPSAPFPVSVIPRSPRRSVITPGPGVGTPLKDEGALSSCTKYHFPHMKHRLPHNSACSTMYSLKIFLLGKKKKKVEAEWKSSISIHSVTS